MDLPEGQDCPALSGIVHGNYNVTGPVQHGDIVGVNCHSGYRISGSSSLKCSDFGSWNGVQASCKAITCRSIVAPGQGSSNTSGSTIFHIGDTIEFHCNVYYRLVGESVITCSENGEWNNRVPFCQAITCRSIKEPDQGTSNVTGSNIFQIRDAVKFQCSVNYTLVGESVITCTENGEWSNREPFCQEITCGKLLPTLYWSWVYSETGPSRPGTIAKIKCHKSHDNIDGHDLICSQNGTWVSDIDQKTYMPFCAEEGDSNKVVPLWLFIVGIPMVQFINYNQPNNSQTNNQAINKSRPDNRGNDSSDNNSQGGTSGDRGQTLTPEDHFPTQVVDDQKNDKIQPHDQQTTNSQADNGSARFASTPIGSDIAQPHSSVAQLSPGSTLTANLRGGVHSQPASDNDDQRAAKILPSGGTQPIHGDDI
ncbi:LYAM2-like protein [Mya arenaria]|uniref:LYAM2-like protein n=1 Tax=Mya arenaria TaxID=6604 RepID=A0ABY7FGB8_MYAAR|nr:LYAM2-like protein [Mya arenaria]